MSQLRANPLWRKQKANHFTVTSSVTNNKIRLVGCFGEMDIYVCFALLKAKVDEELDAIIYDLSLSDTQEIDKQGNMRPFVLESDLLDERYHVPTDC